MRSTQISIQHTGDRLHLTLTGDVDEDTDFSSIDLNGINNLTIDMGKVGYFNSLGVRVWLTWTETFPRALAVEINRCPPVVINKMQSIKGFLPTQSKVSSVLIPYYCSSCKMICDEQVVRVKEPTTPKIQKILCSKCGAETEANIVTDNYNDFLPSEFVKNLRTSGNSR